jgi:hypothetical protein
MQNMTNLIKAAAPSNAARNTTPNVVNTNQETTVDVMNMTLEQRMALMAQLQQAQQTDIEPLEQRKRELEAELVQVNGHIRALKPANDTLAVFRAVRQAVKAGNTSVQDIAEAAGHDAAKVEAMLQKHLDGKDDKAPIFTLKNGGYVLTPKSKK